jgi:hypothetical protein
MFDRLASATGISTATFKLWTAAIVFVVTAVTAGGSAVAYTRSVIDATIDARVEAKVGRVLVAQAHGLYELQLDLARGKRDAADDSIIDWQLKSGAITDPTAQRIVGDRLRSLTNTRDALQRQIETLERNPPKRD